MSVPTARQFKAARALAGLSQAELAQAAGIGVGAVYRLESGKAIETPTLRAIIAALDVAGVTFIDASRSLGEGVRLKVASGDPA